MSRRPAASERLISAVHVVAAAIFDGHGRVLIAQRPPGKHLAGGWEFPGGKLEPGEERPAGLARELREELGIVIEDPRPLMRVRHAYPTREILLDMWIVKSFTGAARSLEGQALRWCPEQDLPSAKLLPADEPIVRALRLPERLSVAETSDYRVTASVSGKETRLQGALCSTVGEAKTAALSGADFLVMTGLLPRAELVDLCLAVPVPVFARGMELHAAWSAGASGVHFLA